MNYYQDFIQSKGGKNERHSYIYFFGIGGAFPGYNLFFTHEEKDFLG